MAPRFPELTKTSVRQRLAARARGRWPQIVELHMQHRGVWSNVTTVLAAADMTVDNIVRVTSYLRDAAYAEANAAARVGHSRPARGGDDGHRGHHAGRGVAC